MEKLCKWILKILGWTVDSGIAPEAKCILLGVPHTSIWDFAIAYLYYRSQGGHAKCMVKKEMFVPVLGSIIRAMGGIPVDRKNPTRMIHSIITEFNKAESLHLAIAPEGTRKTVKHWKTGFHTIATNAHLPVYLAYFDWGTKHVGFKQKVELTDDPKADMARIQSIYKQMNLIGKHPKRYEV
ncbi:MAG: 1-acyl-sn-glycerol-3-phosphate acyltransferase [Bacteroidales bacterium]|nr:1-acyl-sn-glycerol-3-phosphate acyltransferase [Candidatus Colimorpha merdihippi]